MVEQNQAESNSESIQNQNATLEQENEKIEDRGLIQADGESKQSTQAEDEDNLKETINQEIVSEKKKKRQARKHKKRKKNRGSTIPANETTELEENPANEPEIEYIQESVSLIDLAPHHRQFFQVFEAFKIPEPNQILPPPQLVIPVDLSDTKTCKAEDKADSDEEKPIQDKPVLSNRKLKKVSRISMAELKLLVDKPNVVEMHDVNSKDPKLLVTLKAYPNTVPVPRHWCYKRKYLQGKRGFVKPPFQLPEFIRKTGITEMRAVFQEKEESKSLKSKMRDQTRPKMGKIDIDYKKLHDAFFKYQTKPKLTLHGDLYYEGKEVETKLSDKKPGNLSEELFTALGMPVNNKNIPPPWLIAMQRYGPPPSYTYFKIPGLNSPIPSGCVYGYHAGGWGKPPVDESGRPLYGDVFGENALYNEEIEDDYENNRVHWGEYCSEDESEEEESEKESIEETVEMELQSSLVTPSEGLDTPADIINNFSGLETPDSIELRKRRIENEMESNENLNLFEVLPEKPVSKLSGMIMGSTHVYDMTGAGIAPPALHSRNSKVQAEPRKNAVVLTLNPEDLEMDSELIEKRYQEHQDSLIQKENFSDMVLEHVNKKSKNKRKRQDDHDTKKVKKYKEFKF